jgi:hypothetical protein
MRKGTRGVFLALLAAGAAFGGQHLRRQAESTAEGWTEKDGRRIAHTVNRRFTFARAYPERTKAVDLLLEETFDVRTDSGAEGEKGTVTVEAFPAGANSGKPMWKIRADGSRGEAEENLYRVSKPGCCGARDLFTYFGLLNGRELFTADEAILKLEVPNTAVRRYAAYRDHMAVDGIPAGSRLKNVIGSLQWGSDREASSAILLTSASDAESDRFAVKKLRFVVNGKESDEDHMDLWSADGSSDPGKVGGFTIRVHAYTEPDVLIEIPVEGDRLVVEKAMLAPGVSVHAVAASR